MGLHEVKFDLSVAREVKLQDLNTQQKMCLYYLQKIQILPWRCSHLMLNLHLQILQVAACHFRILSVKACCFLENRIFVTFKHSNMLVILFHLQWSSSTEPSPICYMSLISICCLVLGISFLNKTLWAQWTNLEQQLFYLKTFKKQILWRSSCRPDWTVKLTNFGLQVTCIRHL